MNPGNDEIRPEPASELQQSEPKAQEGQVAPLQEKGVGKKVRKKKADSQGETTGKKARKNNLWYMTREDLVPAKESKNAIIEFLIYNLYLAEVYRRVHKESLGLKKTGWSIWKIAKCFHGTRKEFYECVRVSLGIESADKAQEYADKVMKQVLLTNDNWKERIEWANEIYEMVEHYRDEMLKCVTPAFDDPDAGPTVLANLFLLMFPVLKDD